MDLLLRIGGRDPVVGRAILRVVNLLSTPQEVMTDPAVMARVLELAGRQAGPDPDRWRRSGPSHQEMIELVGG